MDMILSWGLLEPAVRLLVALVLGALVGWEREKKGKPAGLRTHMMVTLGAATFVLLGVYLDTSLADGAHQSRVDPGRAIQGVVGGIGFLGAGSIIQSRGSVQGVTTAASIWVSGAIGAACGIGAYWIALLTAVFARIVLGVLLRLEKQVSRES
jgi:putative Mg2+ transporter-C (MgtC) family protein